jgi:dTDP-4-dehydrorhamnose reductase
MILILGATGYLGQAFVAELRKRGHEFVSLSRQTLDYTRFDLLFGYVRSHRPKLIINAAGFTGRPDISACEIARADTVTANTLLPQTVARVSYLTKTPWAHISSSSIFSGAKTAQNGGFAAARDLSADQLESPTGAQPGAILGFTETDRPNCTFNEGPCSFYSGSKALAEESLHWRDECYVWRPGPMFDESDHPRNLLVQISNGSPLELGLGSLSHRTDFVRTCLDLWERNAPHGIYHVANPGMVSRSQMIDIRKQILQSQARMEPSSSTTDLPWKGAALTWSALDSSKLDACGIRLRPAIEALREAAQKLPSHPTVSAL